MADRFLVVDLDDLTLTRRGPTVRCWVSPDEVLSEVGDPGDSRQAALAAFDAVLATAVARPTADGRLERFPVALYNPYSDQVSLLVDGQLRVFCGVGQLPLGNHDTFGVLASDGLTFTVAGVTLTQAEPSLELCAAAIATHPDLT